eukprot:jgi/Chlat1/3288/Chrsp22S03445
MAVVATASVASCSSAATASLSLSSSRAAAGAAAAACKFRSRRGVLATSRRSAGLSLRGRRSSVLQVCASADTTSNADSTTTSNAASNAADTVKTAADTVKTSANKVKEELVADTSFNLAKISLGTVGLSLGSFLLSFGFGAYFDLLPGGAFSAIMLTYGFPLALIGFALKYAELKPVGCATTGSALALRDAQATDILKQVRNDVTRYRYGDEQHLDEALKRIFRYGQAGGIPRRGAPVLVGIREEVQDEGRYTLVLEFDLRQSKVEDFTSREAKFTSFFGPGVQARIVDAGNNRVDVALVATA